MQWNENLQEYLQQNVCSVQNQEQTQEVRLPDGMPDIGRVICTWGQSQLRSKQWRSDGIHVSGGVTGWVLYAPEDGSKPRVVECWLPFQGKWSFPEAKREGVIRTSCLLRNMDARMLSARKLMVRCSVGILGQALELTQTQVLLPADVPSDLQLLKKTYPMDIPVEAGEKLFLMDEEIPMQQSAGKLIAWDITPVISEQNVVGGRAVFKGSARLHMVFMEENGQITGGYYELPFAQFSQLDKDYDKEATITTVMEVSSLEPEAEEDYIRVKAGLIAQYVVYDRALITVAEDAYSPVRNVQPQMEMLSLPVLLDRQNLTLDVQAKAECSVRNVVDTVFLPDHPITYREDGQIIMEAPGIAQILGYDPEGQLIACNQNWKAKAEMPAGEGCAVSVFPCVHSAPEVVVEGADVDLSAQLQICMLASVTQQIPVLSGLEMGEEKQPDPERPSLILRRSSDEGLWNIAKECGSTVEAIRNANKLTDEPVPGQMLLIPVL